MRPLRTQLLHDRSARRAGGLRLLDFIPGWTMIGQKPLLKLFVSLAIDFVGIVSYFLPVPNLQPYPVHEALSLNDLMLPTFRPGTGARARRGASPEPRGGRFWAT